MRQVRCDVPNWPPLVLGIRVAMRGDCEQISIDHVSNLARQLSEPIGRRDIVRHHEGIMRGYRMAMMSLRLQ